MSIDLTTHEVSKIQLHNILETSKQKQMQYNMQVFKSQVYSNISETQINLTHKMSKQQSISRKDLQILNKGLFIPQITHFLPSLLENQIQTRFPNSQFSYVFDHSLRNLSVLQMLNKEIVKTSDLNTESFQDRYMDSVRIVTNFTLETQIPNQKVVLLLLDFHQHPLTVVHFIQFLTRLNYKVVCPYLPDIFLKSSMINPEQSYSFIISLIIDIHKLLIQGEFQTVAHGMSAPIGLRLRQQFGLLCQKVVLCNPLLNFEKPPRTDSFVESDTKQQVQIPSQSESTLSMDDLEYSIEKTQRSNLQAMSPSEQSTIEPVNTQQQYEIVQSRPSKLQRSTKTQVQTLETPSNSIKQTVDNTQYLKDGQTNELNQELQVFYKDVQLLSGIMKAHDVSRLSDLELVTEINRFVQQISLVAIYVEKQPGRFQNMVDYAFMLRELGKPPVVDIIQKSNVKKAPYNTLVVEKQQKDSEEDHLASIEGIIEFLTPLCMKFRPKLREYFWDFDKRRAGVCEQGKLGAALSLMKVSLNARQIKTLNEKYESKRPGFEGSFEWRNFIEDLEKSIGMRL
ncbi:Conserved_hypothetical protein [Hexamita inflata]|uniref:Uncharacterized protein n=1 Tax=Hexamita inflata TaxID=28002 RepID=A0AA86UZS4_9EUKA|nr:Conserved hypothetical protein [Hexamita inflata]